MSRKSSNDQTQKSPATPPTTITGIIDHLFYSSPKFSAGVLRDDATGQTIKFRAKSATSEHDAVVLTGAWVDDPKWGKQFSADSLIHNTALSGDGLASYLGKSPAFKGIGTVKSKIIAALYGADFGAIITADPARIARECKIPEDVALALSNQWRMNSAFNALATQLAAYELTNHQITVLIEKYGDAAPVILRENPYAMLGELYGFGFKRLDEIARKMGVSKTFPPRIRAGISHIVMEELANGHTYIESSELIEKANKLLILDTLDSREIIEAKLDELIRENKLCVESHDNHFLVAIPKYREYERDIAGWLRAGAGESPHWQEMMGVNGKIRAAEIEPSLNEKQREALCEIISNQMTFVTGGAGSGKTYLIAAAVRVFSSCGLSVILAAPTGKAVKRLGEMIGGSHEGKTIHRLLGYNGHDFTRGETDYIESDVLIVDETSMVDIPLAWELLRRVDFSRTSVMFVGDYNQLPPIGPGNILRDAVETKICSIQILADVVRQAGELKRNSVAVLHGKVAPTSAATLPNSAARAWYNIDKLFEAADVENYLIHLLTDILPNRLGVDPWRDIQILTPKRIGALGVNELNIVLQRIYQKQKYNIDVVPPEKNKRPVLLTGDKVILRKNNYDWLIFNGTMGVVVSENKPDAGDIAINFDGADGPIVLNRKTDSDKLREIDLAYILTVHQCQGSEFPFVVVIVHRSHHFMHHRNLFYTAVTRAKKSVIILGDHYGIQSCAKKPGTDARNTWLSLERSNPLF